LGISSFEFCQNLRFYIGLPRIFVAITVVVYRPAVYDKLKINEGGYVVDSVVISHWGGVKVRGLHPFRALSFALSTIGVNSRRSIYVTRRAAIQCLCYDPASAIIYTLDNSC
jgi:hypothetical protein